MKRYPLLDICARIAGHPIQHELLREHSRNIADWQNLIERSEREGMAPLLKKHLEESSSEYPAAARRSLHILAKRHQHRAQVRLEILQEVLELFHRNGLSPMLIKGAALCCTLYPDPGLRPMRDLDILFRPSEVDHAQEIMRHAGFVQSTTPVPQDHFHLPSLHKTAGEVKICIELHRGLYPNCPPYYPVVDFEQLVRTGRKIKVGDIDTVTFNNEETLHYLYQHAFRSPLTYEPYKLINAADIISFTEEYFQDLDWGRIFERFPLLATALPLLHHISPWNFEKIPESFISPSNRKRLEPMPFDGWPHKRLKAFKADNTNWLQILKETFIPPVWWMMIYYGVATKQGCFWYLLQKHPRHVWWWKRLYSTH